MSTSGVGKQSTPDEVPKLDAILRTADISVLETAREGLSAVGEIFKANEQKGHSALQALCQRSFPSFPGGSTWRYTPHEVFAALFPEGTPVDDVQDALTLLDETLESRRMHRTYDEMPIDLQKDLTLQQGLLENEAMTSEPSIVDGKDWLQDPAWVKEVTDWLENPPAYAHDPNPEQWNKTLAGWKKSWGELRSVVQANAAKVYFSNDPAVRAKQYQQYVARLHACWVAADAATKACSEAPPSANDPPAAWKAGLILTYINDMVMYCVKGWQGQLAQLEEMCGLKSQSGTIHPLLQGLIAARDLRREWAQFTLNQGLQASGWDPGLGSDVHYEQALKNVGNDRFGLGYTPEDIQPEGVDQAVDSLLNDQVFWDQAERKCPELIDLLQSKYASFDQSQREKLFELLNEAYREDVGHHPALQMAPKEQSRRLAAMRPLIDQANRVADPEERREALRPLFKEMRERGVAAPMSAISCREAAKERLIGILKVKMLDRAWNQAQGLLRIKGMAAEAPVDALSQAITVKAIEHWTAGVELEAQAIREEIEKSLVDPVVRAEALDVLAEVETRVKSQESELLAERGPGSLHEALQDLQRSELESVVEQYEMSHRTAVAEMVEHWPSYEARLQESSLNRLLVDDESERLTEFGAKVWATLCDAVTLRPEEQVGTPIARWIDTQSKEVMTKLLGLEWGPLDPRVAELLPGRPALEEYVTRLRQGGRSVAHLLEPETFAKILDEDLYRLVPQGSVTIKQLLDMTPEQVTCIKHPFVKELLRDRQCTVTQVLRMTPEQRAALQDDLFENFLRGNSITVPDLMGMTRVEVTEVQRLLAELNGTYSQRELKSLLANLDWRDLDKLVHMTPEQADSLKHPFVWQLLKDNQCTATQVLRMTPQQLTALQDNLFEDFLRGNSITVPDLMGMSPEEIVEVKRLLPLAKSAFKRDTLKVVACVGWRNLDKLAQANRKLVPWLRNEWVQDQLKDGKCALTKLLGMTSAQMAVLSNKTNKVFQPFLRGGAITLGDVMEMTPEQITGVEQALNQLVATHAAARLNQLIPAVGGWRHLDELMHMTPAQAACLDLPFVQELLKTGACTVAQILSMTPPQRAALRDNVFEDFLRWRGITVANLLEMQPEDIAEVKSILPRLKRTHELRTLMWLVYCVGWQNLEKLQQMTPAQADCFKDPFVNELLKAEKCTVDQVLAMTPEQRAALQNDLFKDFLREGGITIRDLLAMNPVEIAAVEQALIPLIATHTADTVNRLMLAVGGWQNLEQLQRMTPPQIALMLAPPPPED